MGGGSLKAFGIPDGPGVADGENEGVEGSVTVEAAPAVEVEDISDPADAPPETSTERLARLRASLSESDATAPVANAEVAELRGQIDGRLAGIQDELRELGKPAEPVGTPAGPHGMNFNDPEIGQAFREVYDSDDPQAFGRAVGAMVALGVEESKREMQEQFDELKGETEKSRQEAQTSENFTSNIATAIPHIRTMGEPEDAIVEDYLANGGESFLGQYLTKYPTLSKDVQGIIGAAMSVARMVEIADARMGSTAVGSGEPATSPKRSVRSEAAPVRGSNRSVQRIRDDAEGNEGADLTPAEKLKQSVVNASRERSLPRVFHS